jgi:CelD/BcsL family acetyltransferase involved in cellulose biosynthesis
VAAERVVLVAQPLADAPWDQLATRPGRSIFAGRAWLDFLAASQGATPVVARLLVDDEPAGWFTGAVVRRLGLKVLGSPLRGWTTSWMGFDLDREVSAADLLGAARRLAFSELGCVHLELMDRGLTTPEPLPHGFRVDRLPGWELRIDRDDDQLLGAMRPHGRRDVRRALRNGIVVEEVDPVAEPGFAAEYYAQVRTAFAKRGLTPTYPQRRVEQMIEHVHPTGGVVLLRARTVDGRAAATGLFPGTPGGAAVFWMGASDPDLQSLLPNEALMWQALRTWRDRGAVCFDFGGGGAYKRKYGGTPVEVPWFRVSRPAALEHARDALRRAARATQRRG